LDWEQRFLEEVVRMAKLFGYERGAVRYVIMSMLFNTIPMYIFGGGFLAVFEATKHTIGEGFISGVFYYFFTKYLPPTSVGQVIAQIAVGAVIAGTLWYFRTPRQGRHQATW
jgi:hypothetical protein